MLCLRRKIQIKYTALPPQVKASFWFLICSFLQKGISVITTPVFTRLLSPNEFGQFNVFLSWMNILTIFVSLNLFCGVYVQGLVKFDMERDKYSSAMQGLTLTLCLICGIIYIVFREFWNGLFSLTTTQMISMLFLIWLNAVFSFWSAEQRIDYKYKRLIAVTILVSCMTPILGIIFVAHADDRVTARILSMVVVCGLVYPGFFFMQIKKGKAFFSAKYWKHALLFNLPLIPHYLSQSVLNSSDRIMIDKMVGADAAGIYSLAHSLALIMAIFNSSLLSTIEPWLYKTIKSRKIEKISQVAYPSFIMIAAINLLLIALAPEAVAIFAPASYYDAIWVIPPIAMSVFFMFAYSFFAVFEFYYEKTKYIALATVGGAVCNIILNYIFIQKFGYYAAGYTTLFCYAVYAVLHYYYMQKICDTFLDGMRPYNLRILLGITVCFLAGGFLFLFFYHYTGLRILLIVFAGIVLCIERRKVIGSVRKILLAKREGND